MYIAKIRIQNFRCFRDVEFDFCVGLNVIIGENNSGKTTLLKAIQYIFNSSSVGRPTIDDFNKIDPIGPEPPFIRIVLTLRSSKNDRIEDKAVVSRWLTKLEEPWEATLTYKFFLPENNLAEYQEDLKNAGDSEEARRFVLERHLKKYVSRVYAGNEDSMTRAEPEYINKFHCEYLDALRDVETKMFMGRDTLLKQILAHFLDSDKKYGEKDEDKAELQKRKNDFASAAAQVVGNITDRLECHKIFELAEKTGAAIGGAPEIGGNLTEEDVLSVLKLMVKEETGVTIPIVNNGLGYNNLIYISLILAKFKMLMSTEMGENAKIFPMLLIEEPEAHLHPALQYNFLKFLKDEIDKQELSRQIFVTTHSAHITAAVGLDPIICLYRTEDGDIAAAYPGKVFSTTDKEDIKSKKYVERYLDATKSEMLFAKSVVLGEGLAEQILLPVLAEYDHKSFEKHHVAMVRVDTLSFKHFIKLFGAGINEENKKYALCRRVACVIDADPSRKEVNPDKGKSGGRWKACYPFQLGQEKDKYEYRIVSGAVKNLIEATQSTDNVRVFYNDTGKGKTLEYDLAFENSDSSLLFDEEVEVKNVEEIDGLKDSSWSEEDKLKALKAVSFLLHVEGRKGEAACDLATKLKDNLKKADDDETKEGFIIPDHLKKAFAWVTNSHKEAISIE